MNGAIVLYRILNYWIRYKDLRLLGIFLGRHRWHEAVDYVAEFFTMWLFVCWVANQFFIIGKDELGNSTLKYYYKIQDRFVIIKVFGLVGSQTA